MLNNGYYLDIEKHKNKLRIDIAWFKMLVFEAIFDNYNKEHMVFLQEQIILKEYYLKELNNGNFVRVSSVVKYNVKPQRLFIDIV